MGSGAVSRYNLSRSQESITVQELNCEQLRESGYKMQYKFIWPAEPESGCKRSKERKAFGPINYLWFLLGWRIRNQAKAVTNKCTLLSVLAVRAHFKNLSTCI